jgi:hypothetical protein
MNVKTCFVLLILIVTHTFARECSLHIGMNLGGINSESTELPFVDIMKYARPWMTKNSTWIEGGANEWNTGFIDSIEVDENGYPLQIPCAVKGAEDAQIVFTGWYWIEAFPRGEYVLLWDGDGEFDFWGDLETISQAPGRIVVNVTGITDPSNPEYGGGRLEIQLKRSNPADHVRNIRFLMPGTESTYQANPYYQPWLDKISEFNAIRFMDWGRTNNWGEEYPWLCYDSQQDTVKIPWTARAKPSFFTWNTNKGVPYEAMIDVCNRLDADMWICVPHNASDGYITEMAALVRDSLNPHLKIYVEYSNETWNWMFGQTQWLYTFGCVGKGIDWPEGIVPYVQNCMDLWTSVFTGQMNRLVRVVGVQAAWQDVSNRIVFNMRPGSFDAFAAAAYFGLPEEGDAALDQLGGSATVADVVYWVTKSRKENEMPWLREQKRSIADKLHIPLLYYEGGQHITPTPFGEEPTYAQALLDVQRDPVMYQLYTSWFDSLETLAIDSVPSLFMTFSFVAGRSARYGSWGMLESITQDTSLIPAPKHRAIMEYLHGCATGIQDAQAQPGEFILGQNYPNPFNSTTQIAFELPRAGQVTIHIYDVIGRHVRTLFQGTRDAGKHNIVWDGRDDRQQPVASGLYFYRLWTGERTAVKKTLLLR